jgi:tetratricopeptide (TPR) repeat protein
MREAVEKETTLKTQLAEERAASEDQKRVVGRLLKQMPALETELAAAQQTAAAKSTALSQREQELEALRLELERREHRIIKAERMAQALEQARDDVRRVDEKKKRDMHYNMAVVYAKEGKFADAEQEYLQALRLDPSDAEIHYNLAILYDDELHDERRAALHYRKYLKLNPHGPDADAVRNWLIEIDLNQ